MASSSSSVRSRGNQGHLPLIMCPDCGEVQVETNISGVPGVNFGKRFYKCPIDSGPDKCGWFKWEEAYACIVRRRQAAALRAHTFNDFKKQLIRDIGFGGVLAIKTLPKLNLKFSSCLMEKVNPETREILIEDYRAIMFSSQDVSNVFGIPCGAKNISSYPTELSEACAEFKKFAEDMSDKGVHSLKAAEAILVKHLDAESRTLDIDMFKIASVIFVVGHMLCPSSKNEYTTVDYGGALSTTAEISEHNWAELVVEHLLAAVRKLKSDLHTRHSTIHLLGCHLFLHVFVLDNLDLGSLTCRDTSLPRIKIFDYDTIRKMIDSLNISQSGEPTFMLARVC
ncbi:hypothetical protein ZWY2020_017612 [Hordeum vulgare]|nr:hypothetical protein ZWY2020_017612 [Hordeum vulgare]